LTRFTNTSKKKSRRKKTMEKLAQEYTPKDELIDEIRVLLDSNEENKYCDEYQLKAYIQIILKKVVA
tara:strand:- start:251 stop:451 length:201 start_codon:yes stop_codon:yes gene_type:complete